MKRIGIDARLLYQTGVGTYLRNLLYYLNLSKTLDMVFYIYVLKGEGGKLCLDKSRFFIREVDSRWHSLSEQLSFPAVLNRDALDLMHFTYFSYPIGYRKKFIATVHDTTPLLFTTGLSSTRGPLYYGIKHAVFQFVLSQQLTYAVRLIAPTATVKKELLAFFPALAFGKIKVIYEGVNYELKTVREKALLQVGLPESFFLYVGNFYPHKNVEALVKAFAQVTGPVSLLLVGPEDFFSKRLTITITNLGLEKRVRFFHQVSPAELVYLYRHARALVHPSLSEGFGLPLIEAGYYRLPIIASNIPVFQELLGSEYLRFDPGSIESIASSLKQFLALPKPPVFSPSLKFSFEKMVNETLQIYKNTVV
ncbi:glycosyltransferase family 4 protein [Candidatus Roizmanbacteria bacterium]|nr:glycosyltransferase family 4 protein [Candidatus Roizmanbacteria bacterium]